MSPELIERENVQLREQLTVQRERLVLQQSALDQSGRRVATLQQQAVLLEQALATAAREKQLLERALKRALRRRTGLDLDAPGQARLLRMLSSC